MEIEELSTEEKIGYIQDTLFVMSGKWKLPILIAINEGNNRFREIQRSVVPITAKVLSKELKDLEENFLVVRKVIDTYPVSVEYNVSPYCQSLKPLIDEMIIWGRNHREKVSKE